VKLFLLFVILPAVELALLIEVGRHLGTLATLGLIVLTGAVGANLARAQGLRVLQQIQTETQAGRMPAEPLIDGAIIVVAGALLITPGVLTDFFGFACLIPGTRRILKDMARRAFERAVAEGRVQVAVQGEIFGARHQPGPIIDIEAEPPQGASDQEDEVSDLDVRARPK
jgi:UPF0716 protein FxsA